MTTLHRKLARAASRVIDEKNGISEYVASDQSVDSDREIVKAAGWRFDQFEKNSPFVDSHQYGSIEFKLGEVIDWRVEGDRLVETVQWIKDVPEHRLATIGWQMTLAGMAPACSVGFLPVKSVERGNGSAWRAACADVGQDPVKTSAVRISLVQQQKELSAVIIGANFNAVAKAHKDGIVTETDLDHFWPDHERLTHKSRVYSFAPASPSPDPTPKSMSRAAFVEKLSQYTAPTRRAAEEIESGRRSDNPDELARIVATAFKMLNRERRHASGDPVAKALANSDLRFAINAVVRYKGHGVMPAGSRELVESWDIEQKSTMFGTSLAASIFPTDIAEQILSTVVEYGAFRDFIIPATGQQMQYAKMSQVPDAGFITPDSGQGVTAYTPDTSLAGTSLSQKMNTVACLLPVSNEWMMDATIDIAPLFLRIFGQAIAKRIDYGCFQGNGADDQTNGKQTGIFNSGSGVGVATAAAGNATLASLQREDFLAAVATVAAAALQRDCRWYLNPAFIPTLLTLREANGTKFLLKTPAETMDGEWHLVGFPITWSPQNPSDVTPGSAIAAFGQPEAMTVSLRDELELMEALSGNGFQGNFRNVRAITRARSDIQEPTFWALLNLAAQ